MANQKFDAACHTITLQKSPFSYYLLFEFYFIQCLIVISDFDTG